MSDFTVVPIKGTSDFTVRTDPANPFVTCRTCLTTYVPSIGNEFYPDGEDPKIGICEECALKEFFIQHKQKPPAPIT